MSALWAMRDTLNFWSLATGSATLAGIVAMKQWRPRWPGLLIAVAGASLAVWLLGLPVETIGMRFGGIPSSLPAPEVPDLSWTTVRDVLPATFTIAFLIGIESLLSAVAADAMAGTRHRSNMEIVAQGAANMASPLFGGLPATGVIARTGTSILAGARTPVAGLLHAFFILVFVLGLSPLASYLALPCLAAVLLNTAWRLMEPDHVWRFLVRAPWDDRVVLLATLLLTVFVDLSVAIAVGVVLASMLFMHRMAETPGIHLGAGHIVFDDVADSSAPRPAIASQELPEGIRVLQLSGPLFFGAAMRLGTGLKGLGHWPRVIILRMRDVPLIDATGIDVLEELAKLAGKHGSRIIISGLQTQPREALHRSGFIKNNRVLLASNSFIAVEKAKGLIARG
jgi:SulP family sulfate permease